MEMVVGFCFDPTYQQVVLVRKNRPEFQAGRLNGVGGKIEPDDPDPAYAMDREFMEETGISGIEWRKFATLTGPNWMVHCFCAVDERYNQVSSATDEQVGVYNAYEMPWLKTLTNLRWLVPLALDFMRAEGGPGFMSATYLESQ
jgi:8-oxo-dGTP diphosphatase